MPIQTVLGPIEPDCLGQVLIHEHISCADWSMRMNFGGRFFSRETVEAMAQRCLAPLAGLGVRTLVDGTPYNLGRDLPLLRRVSQLCGLNIIASSGFYYQEEPWLQARAEEEIFQLLYDEAAGSGILKCAVEAAGVTPLMGKLLRCTGLTAQKRGLPVFCHTASRQRMGLAAFRVLGDYLPPERIVLGHTGDTNDRGYLLEAAQTGCFLGFDRFGYCDRTNSAEDIVSNLLWLFGQGYGRQLLLSHDAAVYLAFWDSWEASQKQVTDFTFIHRTVLPMLRAGGLADAELDGLLRDNPRRLLAGAGA